MDGNDHQYFCYHLNNITTLQPSLCAPTRDFGVPKNSGMISPPQVITAILSSDSLHKNSSKCIIIYLLRACCLLQPSFYW
ncbi:MAG TPA: hypothetical protein DEO73_02365 [Pantoea sp.]|nr:hypothetical protein [Pantoea sp.]